MPKLLIIFALLLVPTINLEAGIKILALGDSLTEGLGVPRENAYPRLLEEKLKEQGFDVEIINAGVSGSTSATAYGRLQAYLNQKLDLVILALGANDGLRGLSLKDRKSTRLNSSHSQQSRMPSSA